MKRIVGLVVGATAVAGPPTNVQFMVRLRRNMPRPPVEGSLNSSQANLATTCCRKPAFPVTRPPKIATLSSSRGFIDEIEQILDHRATRRRNRGTDCGFLRGHSHAATDDITGIRVPFLHGFFSGQSAAQSELASLERADEWLNSPPLTASALRGKVVLVDFWTYTCINWLRTLPYVRAWAEKYKDQGLVVIGVHAPEFSFEKNLDNVRRAVKEMRVDYPVAVDSDHVIWRAFSNQYWPALYFVDAQGRVRHHHFGEGAYEQSEMIIQQLLAEAGASEVSREPTMVDGPRSRSGRRLAQPEVWRELSRLRAHPELRVARWRGP